MTGRWIRRWPEDRRDVSKILDSRFGCSLESMETIEISRLGVIMCLFLFLILAYCLRTCVFLVEAPKAKWFMETRSDWTCRWCLLVARHDETCWCPPDLLVLFKRNICQEERNQEMSLNARRGIRTIASLFWLGGVGRDGARDLRRLQLPLEVCWCSCLYSPLQWCGGRWQTLAYMREIVRDFKS